MDELNEKKIDDEQESIKKISDIPETIKDFVIENLKICLIDKETQVMQVVSTLCKVNHNANSNDVINKNISLFTHQLSNSIDTIIQKNIQIDKSFSNEQIDIMNIENIKTISHFDNIFQTNCTEILSKDYQTNNDNPVKYHIGIFFVTNEIEYIHICPIQNNIDKNKEKIKRLSLIFLYYLKGAILKNNYVNKECFVQKLEYHFAEKQFHIKFDYDIKDEIQESSENINEPKLEITVDNKADIKKGIETINDILNKSQMEITVDNKADIQKSIETINDILNKSQMEITVDNKADIQKSIETINKILNKSQMEIIVDNKADIQKSIETINKILNKSQMEIIVDKKADIKKSIETINKILNDPKIEITFDKKADIKKSIAKIQTLLANSKTIIEVNEKNDIVDFVKKQTNLAKIPEEIKKIIENIANITINSNKKPPNDKRLLIEAQLVKISKQIRYSKPDDIQNVVTYLNEQENENNESLLKKINQIFVTAISKQTVIFEKEIPILESNFKEIYNNSWLKPFFYKGMSIKANQPDVALKIDEKKGQIVMNQNFKLEYIPP